MTILEINATALQQALTEYGVLGILVFALGYFAWVSYKKLVDRNDALEEKVDALQVEVRQLLVEERDRMSRIVEENTKAINELRQIIVTALISPME